MYTLEKHFYFGYLKFNEPFHSNNMLWFTKIKFHWKFVYLVWMVTIIFFWTILYPFINKCADNKFYPMILLVGSCLIFKQTGDVVIQSYNNVKFLNGISSMRMHSNFCYKKQS